MRLQATILVVDDETTILFYLEELFSRDGYEVVAVQSGEEALAVLETQSFDIAIIDLKMEGIGGIEVLKALRRHSPSTAAIMLTAHGALDTALDALRLGAHDYLLKPCAADDLRESVRTALRKRDREDRRRAVLAELERNLERDLHRIRTTALGEEEASRPDVAKVGSQSPLSMGRGHAADRHAWTYGHH